MRNLLQFIHNELQNDRPVVSAVIVSSSGSTPRSTGSRMAVGKDGQTLGSVGGGPGEAMAQRHAHKVYQEKRSRLLKLDLTGKDAADAGMICGGQQEILIEYISPRPENLRLFSQLLESWDAGQGSALYTVFREDSHGAEILVRTQDSQSLPDSLPQSLRQVAVSWPGKSRLPSFSQEDGFSVLMEPIRSPGTVVIAGAGHVGQATAVLCAMVGFITTVLDDRAGFLNEHSLPGVHQRLQVDRFETCFQGLQIPTNACIVILTRGHVHDKTVLAQALQTPASYIGMIGSTKKRDAIYSDLREQGFEQWELDRVHCPIGLSIGADTPQEIAVSIVAELIQERAKTK
jgi:xanthine dehydrogenase accessory factor